MYPDVKAAVMDYPLVWLWPESEEHISWVRIPFQYCWILELMTAWYISLLHTAPFTQSIQEKLQKRKKLGVAIILTLALPSPAKKEVVYGD